MIDSLTHPGSYLGIFVFLVLTGCGMPIPEEVALVLAGVLSAQGKLEAPWAFAACLSGAIVGDLVMYAIGYHFGHNLLSRHPRIARFLHAEKEPQFEKSLERHGFKALLLSRFLVGVRGPAYIAAGVVRMPLRRFILCDLVAATLVVGLFFGASYYFGERMASMIHDAERTVTLIVLLVAAVAGLWVLRRNREGLFERVVDDEDDEAAERSEARNQETVPQQHPAARRQSN